MSALPQRDANVEGTPQVKALESGLSAAEFKLAFRHHAAGVAVVTADAGDGPVGITVSSLFSVSAEPPLMVFSISNSSSSAPTVLRAESLVVHCWVPSTWPSLAYVRQPEWTGSLTPRSGAASLRESRTSLMFRSGSAAK